MRSMGMRRGVRRLMELRLRIAGSTSVKMGFVGGVVGWGWRAVLKCDIHPGLTRWVRRVHCTCT